MRSSIRLQDRMPALETFLNPDGEAVRQDAQDKRILASIGEIAR